MNIPLPEPLGEPEHHDSASWECAVCTLLEFERPAAATTLIAGTPTCRQHTRSLALSYPGITDAVRRHGGTVPSMRGKRR